jgi:stage II sporulation protein D
MRRRCANPVRRLCVLVWLCACAAVSALVTVSCSISDAAPEGGAAAEVHPARSVRVLLVRDTERLVVSTSGRLRVRDRSGQELSEPLPPLKKAPILFAHRSPTAMVVGHHRITAEVIELIPEAGERIGLLMPAGRDKKVMRRYPGYLRCLLKDDGTADIINVVDVEAYLRGVLRGEVPPNWHKQTYRAQAIAARTYVLYEKGTVGRNRNWDVTATARSQMYVGIDRDTEKTKAARAVDATRGIVLTWQYPEGDRIFCAYYSAVCGGTTQDASFVGNAQHIPPLAGGVECEHCWRAPKGTYHWKPVTLTKEAIGRALARRYEDFARLGSVAEVKVTARTPDYRAQTVRVTDRKSKSAELPAEAFRLTIDPTGWTVKSTHFRIRDHGKAVTFTHGRGWGHGAGLCQWGAEGMARNGATAEQILEHYYPGAGLVKVYD